MLLKADSFRKKNNFKILYESFRDEAIKPKSFVTKTWKGEENACALNFELFLFNSWKQQDSNIPNLLLKFDVKFA